MLLMLIVIQRDSYNFNFVSILSEISVIQTMPYLLLPLQLIFKHRLLFTVYMGILFEKYYQMEDIILKLCILTLRLVEKLVVHIAFEKALYILGTAVLDLM